MIITIFIIIIVLCLFLLIVGKYIDAPPLQLAGYLFMFLLGVGVAVSGLAYESGIDYTYTCGCCENGTFKEGNITEYYSYECVGTPFDCSYYSEQETNCLLAGCSYDNETLICSGTPDDCDTRLIERDCEAINCTWDLGQEPALTEGCTNGSIILKNETKVYSAYSGETGIAVSHYLGYFLCIIAVFGWIIVFMNLKAGLP